MKETSLFDSLLEEPQKPSGPVTCLGMTFENDEARRAHFTEELRKQLQDPEFRKIEGFPIGSDEDILNLSDPPYYTACPNPWIADFIAEWEAQKPELPEGYHYHREPFAADVSEGKNDPIYNAHSYHTKVPHKAIMRYILHYTQPCDIVFDGFCGTGMTGVAAQMCGDREVVMSLGYQVKPDGTILQEETDEDGKKVWRAFSKLGVRKAILNDLSPAATFIAYNYNTQVDVAAFEKEAKRILKEVEKECGWMYETLHTDGKTKGRVDYVVWSEIFSCPECAGEVVFLEEAMDMETKRVMKEYPCPHCKAVISKQKMSRTFESYYDSLLKETKERPKRKPIQISYRIGKVKHSKSPDDDDLNLLERIAALDIPDSIQSKEYPYDDMWEAPRMLSRGITHVHHLFLLRQLYSVGFIWKRISDVRSYQTRQMLRFWIDQSIPGMSVLNRFQPIQHGRDGGSQVNRQMSGVYYVPSQISECSPWYNLSGKLSRLAKAFKNSKSLLGGCHIGTGSSTHLNIEPNSIDYVFIDPPFGDNFAYAELNFLVESWLGVLTDMKPEAIVDRSKKNRDSQKGLSEYRQLMTACFQEVYRILKPGRWMTVEFSNTKASVWNSIQVALTEAGFIVANVSALDKQQGSFKAVTTPTAVKQDLVISAYKPNGGFEDRFKKEAQTEEGVWDFVRTHLKYLPVTKRQGVLLLMVPERDPRILFDQMVAYYIRKGYPVPISSQEFQVGLSQRFIERDGMYFLPDQVAEYDRKKMTSGAPQQLSMFVSDEASAIQWLRQLIKEKPQTFSDINPQFMQQLGGWSKNEAQLDLRELLHQNFLCYDGKGPVPEQIHAYLSTNWKDLRNLPKDDPTLVAKARDRWYVPDPNKAGDLEKLREKALLKEFEEYKEVKKKLKVFRLEAVRAGFKKAWQERDYAVIVAVADKIPNNVLEEDPKLLMWYDQAVTRMGGE
ncbi:DNA methyltransferase [Acidithiobacillus ferrooxidans]|uniref:DNA methyltransferase n=1 Tax=Acidithiobacillus ferrooxidans TaxID=920 RepID=UPI001C079C0A|nr:DNA methyltransferase [Acidithiobacillus ferrooxidans]